MWGERGGDKGGLCLILPTPYTDGGPTPHTLHRWRPHTPHPNHWLLPLFFCRPSRCHHSS
ncbi:MAG: hypothetical protein F6J93_31035 [Oscillatoria sp. SIO1A7]|nr:hypothetical protein [Oscillatoria sp. SIO1A7]